MKVLVVYPSLDTIALLDGLAQHNGSTVTYCASATDAIEALKRTRDPSSWVLIEDDGRHADVAEIGSTIRAAGFDASICYLSHRTESLATTTRAQPPICAVEQTSNGLQILRCALHRAGKASERPAGLATSSQEKGFVFEYHAPCKSRG
jgi:CheY-like chemotaxis protein